MDHADAVALLLAERYVLGELEEEEAEAFEAHLFGCPVCAEQVRLGFEFLNEARELARQTPPPVAAGSDRRRFCRTFPKRRKRPKHRRWERP